MDGQTSDTCPEVPTKGVKTDGGSDRGRGDWEVNSCRREKGVRAGLAGGRLCVLLCADPLGLSCEHFLKEGGGEGVLGLVQTFRHFCARGQHVPPPSEQPTDIITHLCGLAGRRGSLPPRSGLPSRKSQGTWERRT